MATRRWEVEMTAGAGSDPGAGPASFGLPGVGSGVGAPVDDDYPPGAKLGAAALTVVAPFISLVAAMMIRSSQPSPIRRATLGAWAIASGVWLALGLVIVIVTFAATANTAAQVRPNPSGPCDGGPEMGTTGTSLGNGNYRFPCEFGGSTVVHLGS
jgi:hypothetical protein